LEQVQWEKPRKFTNSGSNADLRHISAIAYYISLPFLHGLAALPMRALYLLSDLLYVILFRVAGYRRKVVRKNLRNSFPEKNANELLRLEKAFQHWFCDLVLETLKTLRISPKQVERLVKVEGEEVLHRYFEQGRSIILVMGHWGNWELGGARFSQLPYQKLNVIYHPLQEPHFNELVIRMRTRLGNGLYPMREAARMMLRDRDKGTATAFIADQTPSPETAYWTTFLGQQTPVFRGPGKLSKRFGMPIVYLGIDRTRRGHYIMRFEDLVPDPALLEEDTITELHVRRLEQDIRKRPEIWLWSHRRWKHPPPANSPSEQSEAIAP
jgi:KDO2-lipid IV(A) lauroyltransferase